MFTKQQLIAKISFSAYSIRQHSFMCVHDWVVYVANMVITTPSRLSSFKQASQQVYHIHTFVLKNIPKDTSIS